MHDLLAGIVKLHKLSNYVDILNTSTCLKPCTQTSTQIKTHTHRTTNTTQHNRKDQNRTEHTNNTHTQHTHTTHNTLMTLLSTCKRRRTMNLFDPICNCCTSKDGKESKHFQLTLTTYGQITCHHVSTMYAASVQSLSLG